MLLEKFKRTIEAKSRAKNTLELFDHTVVKAEKYLDKPLETATFDELLKYIEYIKENGMCLGYKGRGLSKSSIWTVENKLIQFYTFCFNETDDINYNKIVKKLKSIRVDKPKNKIQPTDLLYPEDVKMLINVATIERDRCLVASFFEAGMRIGELLALDNDMVIVDETKQEVTFNIPDTEDTDDNDAKAKTGARSVLCLEIAGYVLDWMKCNPSDKFMPLSESGVRKVLRKLFQRAGIKKRCYPHIFRHSSITNACILKMQPNQISMRYWGIPNSSMLNTYIHLSDRIVNTGYRDAKGMGNGNIDTVINPLAVRCVECGKLIESGNLCKQCGEIRKLKEQIGEYKNMYGDIEKTRNEMQQIIEAIKNGKVVIHRSENEGHCETIIGSRKGA